MASSFSRLPRGVSIVRRLLTRDYSVASSFIHQQHHEHSFHQNHALEKYLKLGENKLTLKQLIEFGSSMTPAKLLVSANFVRKELPIRLAHRIADMHALPYIVGTNEYIEATYSLYWKAFDSLRKFPEIRSLEDNERYCKHLKESLKTHELILPALVVGLHQSNQYFPDPLQGDEFFKTMLKSRMGRRILAEQHLKLSDPNHQPGTATVLSSNIHTGKVIQKCYEAAKKICLHTFGICPAVEMEGDTSAVFSGVSYHAEYIIYELFKNAMVAVVNRHRISPDDLPPIVVTVADSPNKVAIRVSDQGGGISHEDLKKIWNFSFSTAPKPRFEDFFTPQMGATLEEQSLKWPIAGAGYGLPISRVFAEYFGGSLELHSIHGYGADAHLMMKKKVEDQLDRVV